MLRGLEHCNNGCYMGLKRVLQRCYKGVLTLLLGCYKGVTRMLHVRGILLGDRVHPLMVVPRLLEARLIAKSTLGKLERHARRALHLSLRTREKKGCQLQTSSASAHD
jgi:hypothetical protein